MQGKGFSQLVSALPGIAKLEQTKGLLRTFLKQWGGMNTVRIFLKTGSRTGHLKTIKALLNFRLDKITPNFLVSLWDVFGDREALISENRRFTYSDLKTRVFKLANALQSLGLKPKDRCAELLYNGNEFFEGFFACSLIGCPMPFLNWHMTGPELIHAINATKAKALILSAEFIPTVLSIKDQIPTVQHFIVAGGSAAEGMLSYEGLLEKAPDTMPDANFIVALNPYTGGTTGMPKNVNYFDSIGYAFSDLATPPDVSLAEYLKFLILQFSFMYYFGGTEISDPITKNMRCLIPGPLYHAGTIAAWVPFILLGGTGVIMKSFTPESFLKSIEAERINWVFVVPTMLEKILSQPEEIRNRYSLKTMHTLLCAAAPATPELKKATNVFFRQNGCPKDVLNEYYGSSEIAATSLLLPVDYAEKPKRYESVGKIRCAETRIYDKETGTWCPPGKDGSILSRSLTTLNLDYVGSTEKASKSFTFIDGKAWFDDGLRGHMDEDGFLFLTGREKEMIITGGVNIFPNEIETAIKRHSKVLDVAVIRYPDKVLGEVPAAIVQPKDGVLLESGEIIEFCKDQKLMGFKIPRYVEIVSTLPRHIDGKMRKKEIEDKYWEGIERRG
jgi:long-chain acyl-CoA synthetase